VKKSLSLWVSVAGCVYFSLPQLYRLRESDSENEKYYSRKYVCINQPDTKSNHNHVSDPNPTTKQHTVVSIQLIFCHMCYASIKFHTKQCYCIVDCIVYTSVRFHCQSAKDYISSQLALFNRRFTEISRPAYKYEHL